MSEVNPPDNRFKFAEGVLEMAHMPKAAERIEIKSNPEGIDSHITELERQNEIHTPAQRLLAASLLVEPIFLYPAVITGQSEGVECAFSKERWANYLRARLLTKSYRGPLNLDFVLDVYGCLLEKSDREDTIQDTQFEKGYLGIGSNAGQPYPMTCTESQIAIINANPYTKWLPVIKPDSGTNVSRLLEIDPIAPYLFAKMAWLVADGPSSLGFINYVRKTKGEKLQGLAAICDQYNKAKDSQDHPDRHAALLKHRIVSIHAGRDYNGAAAGLLMNWSLECDDLGPSIPYPDDLLTTEEQLSEYIRSGRMIYEQSRQKVEAGVTDPVVIFGLENERANFVESPVTAPRLEQGKLHERAVFETFLRAINSKTES